jgi:hypothetical protein
MRRITMSRLLSMIAYVGFALALLAAGCGSDDDDDAGEAGTQPPVTATVASSPATAPSPTAASPTAAASPTVAALPTTAAIPTLPPDLPEPVRAAVEQAADDANTTVDQVELLGFNEEEWSNSGLGCPVEGQFYAQVITPGYRVVVRVEGRELEYHTDLRGSVVLCR